MNLPEGKVGKFLSKTDFLLMLVASSALFALMLLTFSDVMLRSLLNKPIQEATELTKVLLAIMVFSAWPPLMGRGSAIAIDLFDSWFQRRHMARAQHGLVNILSGAMLIWPSQRLWVLAERALSYGEVTEFLHLPQYLVLMFITFFVAITSCVTILRGLYILFSPNHFYRGK